MGISWATKEAQLGAIKQIELQVSWHDGFVLQWIGSRISEGMGRDSALIRLFRPTYELVLGRCGGFERTINGHERFLIDPRYRGMFPETYEPTVCEYLRQHVKPGDICLDVGAHVGVYALCLAQWAGAEGLVFAFEPNPDTRAVLENNLRRNLEGERVTVIPQGVSDCSGEATFCAAGIEGFSRLGSPNRERPEMHRSFPVQLTTIDGFCGEQRVMPNWILIDIEGYEVAALRGARQTLAKGKVNVVIEMHPFLWRTASTSRDDFAALLAELHLRPRALSGQADLWEENGQVVLERI